ncbi:MAG: DUF501 domain-containing protein [Aquificae bacterium]|nr:DUF501 domain-containing protein [Aquificota bacterium]
MKLEVVETPLILFDEEKNLWIPQPTRFWILDKAFHKAISRLEEKGLIKKWERKISENDKLFQFFKSLHEKEVLKRKKILERDFLHLKDTKAYKILLDEDLGIGSIRNFKTKPFKVKCFHLWTAYHIGDKDFKNPIGEYVLKHIEKSF